MYIRFKPLYPEDRDWFYNIARDSDAITYWVAKEDDREIPLRSRFDIQWDDTYFSNDRPLLGRCYAIEAGGRRIGVIAYGPVDEVASSTELRVLIADTGDRDKGYGSRSLSRFAAFLYSTLGVRRCRITVDSTDRRAVRTCEKAGFTLREKHDGMPGPWRVYEREFQLEERL